ncbi:MAG TPA: HAMP domain-containing sensor histidine kinase [Solirubrobacterales bacterium]|jgi:signal transduction histidine kinase
MLDSIGEGLVLACPLAITCATVVVADRVRERRRRELLNRALHELRRPLQALVLQARRGSSPEHRGRDQLEQALEALAGVDRELNGEPPPRRAALVDARTLAADAVGRWRGPAALDGRWIELAWNANGSRLVCDEAAIAAALDNLIANALEHGSGPIRIDGSERAGRLRLTVADGVDAGGRAIGSDPRERPRIRHRHQAGSRRGHGLRIVAEVAAAHGGRFAACAHERGASAVLELPLAGSKARSPGV